MAPSSHQSQINPSDQSRTKFYSSSYSCGSSKAQSSLQKILHIILTIPNQPLSENDIKDVPPPPPAAAEELKDPPISPAATTPSDKGLALNVEGTEVLVVKEETDNMGLLIDAAKMVLGEIKESHDQKNQSFEDLNDQGSREKPCVNDNKRRNQCWKADLYEEMEPVVRSKRGRTRVLPCRYRDSVLEPLTRASRNRASIVSSKRRLR